MLCNRQRAPSRFAAAPAHGEEPVETAAAALAVDRTMTGKRAQIARPGHEVRETSDFARLDGDAGETRVTRAERLGLVRSLLRFERAGAIDEPPAGAHERRRLVEQAALEIGELSDVRVPLCPSHVRVAPDRAGCGAGRIEENGVEHGFVR